VMIASWWHGLHLIPGAISSENEEFKELYGGHFSCCMAAPAIAGALNQTLQLVRNLVRNPGHHQN
jgi:hypothetical protein